MSPSKLLHRLMRIPDKVKKIRRSPGVPTNESILCGYLIITITTFRGVVMKMTFVANAVSTFMYRFIETHAFQLRNGVVRK